MSKRNDMTEPSAPISQDQAVRPWVTWVSFLCRWALGLIWIVSGALKASNPLETKVAINAYQIVPQSMTASLAFMLPALEILLGVILIIGLRNRWTAIISALVFALFIAAIAQAWARGLRIDCGCFGGGGVDPNANAITYLTEIARDTIFMVLAVWLACFPHTPLTVDPESRAPLVMPLRKKA